MALEVLRRHDVVVGPDGHLPLLVMLQQVTSIDQSGMIMVQNDEHSYQFARNLPCGRLPRWPAVLWRGITTISCDDGRHGGDGDSPRSSCGCSFAARRTRALRQNHRPSLSQPCALAAVDAAVPSERLLGAPNRSAANISGVRRRHFPVSLQRSVSGALFLELLPAKVQRHARCSLHKVGQAPAPAR